MRSGVVAGAVVLAFSLSGCGIAWTSADLPRQPTNVATSGPTGQIVSTDSGVGPADTAQSGTDELASSPSDLASAAAKAGQPKPSFKCLKLTDGEKTNIEGKSFVQYGSGVLGKTAKVQLTTEIWVMAAQVKKAHWPGPNAEDPTMSPYNPKTIIATWLLVRPGPGHAYSVEVVKNFVVGGIDYVYGPAARQKAIACLG